MTVRKQLIIMAAALCHLFAAAPLVTSQLLPSATVTATADDRQDQEPQPAAPTLVPPAVTNLSAQGEPITIKAKEQEKAGDVYTLRGDVEIDYRGMVLRGDQISYNAQTGDVTATGHLVLDGGPHDEHIESSHGTYNVRSQTGQFYDVVGTTGVRFRSGKATLTSSNPFAFSGVMVEKVSEDRYVIHHGSVTSCEMPKPKWSFNAEKVIIDVGTSAKIYGSTFRVKGVPIVYLPFAGHPVETLGRQTGFLIPTAGASSRKGTILGESVYFTLGRSADLLAGAEYFSSRGWSQNVEFRAKPSEDSFVNLKYFGVLDRGFEQNGVRIDQGGEDITLNAVGGLPWGFRGVISAEYLSSFVFRLAFTESFSQTVNSEVKSDAFASKTVNGFSFNFMGARYQNFQSTLNGDYISILHEPSFEISSVDRQLGSSRVFWSFDAAAEGVARREPEFTTSGVVGRFDLNPRGAIAVTWHGWSFRPEVGMRDTAYTQQRGVVGPLQVAIDDAVNRRALEASMEIRPPVLGRVFDRTVYGRKVKHTIEPRLIYRFAGGVDNFQDILRFDARDILSDTSELEYGIIQRLYAKREGDDAVAHEILSWELEQKYFFNNDFGNAVVPGRRNVLTTTADFAGIAFLTGPRLFSPIVSKIRARTSAHTDLQWELDYDTVKGRINASTVLANYRFGDFFVGGSHAYLLVPGEIFSTTPLVGPDKFNQFRTIIGYGHPNKRGFSAAANIGFDSNFDFLQYGAFQTSYNWDCCGLAFEFRRLALGSVRNENQYRFSFNLANVASFGNMKRQERLF
jgi:LPS-assembly protein